MDAECLFGLTGGRYEVAGLRLPMLNQLDHADRLRKPQRRCYSLTESHCGGETVLMTLCCSHILTVYFSFCETAGSGAFNSSPLSLGKL